MFLTMPSISYFKIPFMVASSSLIILHQKKEVKHRFITKIFLLSSSRMQPPPTMGWWTLRGRTSLSPSTLPIVWTSPSPRSPLVEEIATFRGPFARQGAKSAGRGFCRGRTLPLLILWAAYQHHQQLPHCLATRTSLINHPGHRFPSMIHRVCGFE